jgi:hypothetical protein
MLLGVIDDVAKDGTAAPDDSVCITLLRVLCRVRKVSLAGKVLQAFGKTAVLVPTIEMYTILIGEYCMMGEIEEAISACPQTTEKQSGHSRRYKSN